MNLSTMDQKKIEADVLVMGGGLAGCFAAIKAAEQGVKVVLFDKGHIRRSGNGATGLHRIPLIHPDFNHSFRDFARLNPAGAHGLADEDISYAFGKDSLGRINDLESYGVQVRDEDGKFDLKEAEDIAPGKVVVWPPAPKVWQNVKPKLAKKVKSFPNVKVLNRVSGMGILTKEGVPGSAAVGAIGMETRTGKLVICRAKAVVLASGGSYRLGRHKNSAYAPTRFIECGCPLNCGDGQASAFRAGANLVNMEFANFGSAWKDFSHWGGGPFFSYAHPLGNQGQNLRPPKGVPTQFSIYKRTHNFGFDSEGPLFYDASNPKGRSGEDVDMGRLLWAMENESTAPGYFLWLKERGEDFSRGPVEFEWHPGYLHNNQAGVYIDKNAKSSLSGLFCAGDVIGGGWRQSAGGALVFGARAGANASKYAKRVKLSKLNMKQVERETEPIRNAATMDPSEGYSWIELEDKARMIASEYGPPFTNDAKLERGIVHLERIKERYLPKIYARNPREMIRASEVGAIFHNVECHLRAGLYRKETRNHLRSSIFTKSDYPEQDDKKWLKHTLLRNRNGKIKITSKPVKKMT